MKRYRIFIFLFVLLAIPNLCLAQGTKEALLGAWKLTSFEGVAPDGKKIEPWKNPVGLIIYDPAGYVSVQFGSAQRAPFASGEGAAAQGSGTPQEIKNAFVTYYAYFGRYEVNENEGSVIHHIQSSLIPNEVGLNYKRNFKISGDRLALTTPPQKGPNGLVYIWSLNWERVK